MTAGLIALSLASAIAPPRGGSFSRQPSEQSATDTAPPPAAGPSENTRSSDAPQRLESAQEREERLMREGIRKRPDPKIDPPRDYLSVLKTQVSPEGDETILAPQLWFGLGFSSWFPLRESSGRKSDPQGSYQGFAQLWNWGAKTSEGLPCKSARSCTYQSLHFAFLASQAETTVAATEPVRGDSVNIDVLRSDFEMGVLWRRDWHWALAGSDTTSFAFAFMGGLLPMRQRIIETYGSATAKDEDFAHSGVQLNPLGTLMRFSFSVLALSIFEAGIVAGLSTSSPAEVKTLVGLEFALRDPQRPQEASSVENPAQPKNDGTSQKLQPQQQLQRLP